jgi:hypothetical protein
VGTRVITTHNHWKAYVNNVTSTLFQPTIIHYISIDYPLSTSDGFTYQKY